MTDKQVRAIRWLDQQRVTPKVYRRAQELIARHHDIYRAKCTVEQHQRWQSRHIDDVAKQLPGYTPTPADSLAGYHTKLPRVSRANRLRVTPFKPVDYAAHYYKDGFSSHNQTKLMEALSLQTTLR